jgi:hypothetical protein
MDHAAAGVESNIRLTDPSQLEYPAIRLGCRDRMQFDQLKRREFITLLGSAARPSGNVTRGGHNFVESNEIERHG